MLLPFSSRFARYSLLLAFSILNTTNGAATSSQQSVSAATANQQLSVAAITANTTTAVQASALPASVLSQLGAILAADEAIQRSELPTARLPPPSPEGWRQCDYSCMLNFNSSVRTAETGSPGALEVDVQFKPLPSITSAMMVWLFSNLQKPVAWLNGTRVTLTPMRALLRGHSSTTQCHMQSSPACRYQFFHHIDHVVHKSSTAGVRVGTNLTWCEIPLTGCLHQPLSPDTPWLCPTNRSGFLRSSPLTGSGAWPRVMHTKVVMSVTAFNSSTIEFVARRKNLLFGGSGTRVVATTRHTWQDSPDGLMLRSQQWLGLMAAPSSSSSGSGDGSSSATTTFDRSPLAAATNQVIGAAYIGGGSNVPPGNLTAAGYMAVAHYLQEYGGLPRWLPQVYAARQSVVPAWASTLRPIDYRKIFALEGGGDNSGALVL